MRKFVLATAVLTLLWAIPGSASSAIPSPIRTLDGAGNNVGHPTWGQAGTTGAPVNYLRLAPANYANGIERVQPGPDIRNLSNRIINDIGQNLFSENDVSQWGWAWGQFMDHDFGLRDETPGDGPSLPFNANDPLEDFRNDFGVIDFSRTQPSPGTGFGSVPRMHINTISSYIDGSGVYGVTNQRLDWLRNGSFDGNPTNNQATLMLPNGYLPLASARGNVGAAPKMDLMGALTGHPERAVVAGDVRANENIALTSLHTLFAREHNRIVRALPVVLGEEEKFQIARRVVGAELQFITYNEFLPALGVRLAAYAGYNPNINATLSEEFAAMGYRAHSMIHGEFEPTVASNRFTTAQLDAFRQQGITVENNGDGTTTLVIPLVLAFGNPSLLQAVSEDAVVDNGLAEAQYKNDEQIDNSLRSVLFQVPKPGVPDPSVCGSPVINPDCFVGVSDLGAIDVARQRDHGIQYYNNLRRAYGLAPKTTWTSITGESTDQLPAGLSINDPRILEFVQLRDAQGNVLPADTEEAVVGIRRSTLAARLRAVYGNIEKIDAFVGMISERHPAGSELGELQRAIWKKQFEATRDGDRFFYLNDPALPAIRSLFGIDYRRTLAQVIESNTNADVSANVFRAE